MTLEEYNEQEYNITDEWLKKYFNGKTVTDTQIKVSGETYYIDGNLRRTVNETAYNADFSEKRRMTIRDVLYMYGRRRSKLIRRIEAYPEIREWVYNILVKNDSSNEGKNLAKLLCGPYALLCLAYDHYFFYKGKSYKLKDGTEEGNEKVDASIEEDKKYKYYDDSDDNTDYYQFYKKLYNTEEEDPDEYGY